MTTLSSRVFLVALLTAVSKAAPTPTTVAQRGLSAANGTLPAGAAASTPLNDTDADDFKAPPIPSGNTGRDNVLPSLAVSRLAARMALAFETAVHKHNAMGPESRAPNVKAVVLERAAAAASAGLLPTTVMAQLAQSGSSAINATYEGVGQKARNMYDGTRKDDFTQMLLYIPLLFAFAIPTANRYMFQYRQKDLLVPGTYMQRDMGFLALGFALFFHATTTGEVSGAGQMHGTLWGALSLFFFLVYFGMVSENSEGIAEWVAGLPSTKQASGMEELICRLLYAMPDGYKGFGYCGDIE